MDKKVVIGIIEKGNKFLMAKRKVDEADLTWSFPGGKIENNESEEQAIEREIFEETNVIVKAIKKLGERIHPTTSREISYMLCKYISGDAKAKASDELVEVGWMTPSELLDVVTSDVFTPVKNHILKQ